MGINNDIDYQPFQSLVNVDSIPFIIPECTITKKQPTKTFSEIQHLITNGRHKEVKKLLRNHHWPTDNMIRTQLWSALCKQHNNNNMTEGFYWDLVVQLFGTKELPDKTSILPPFVDSKHRHIYHLSAVGKEVADRVVCVLGFACPDITYSPAIYSLVSLFLHFMPEEECYNSLTSLVSSKRLVFMTQTKSLYEVTWRTVMRVTRKHASSASVHLTKFCLATKMEHIYKDWMWWIFQGLPFHHIVRVMDCYLHEGIKVLYRVAMAILKIFYKHSSKRNSPWALEALNNGLQTTLMKFCRQMPASPNKLLKTAFNIRALSAAYLHRVFVKTEMSLKTKTVVSNSHQLIRSRSSENLPTSQSQVNIQLMSHTLSTRELFTLWSWLPMRITMYQPILLYTTEEHGCSLTTFYFRVEQHEPTLLIIKTCSDDVFGAYCSTKWLERNRKDERGNRTAYFGTGETFLFSLFPERSKYPWVGMENDNFCHSNELFMAADSKMITIGGGDGQAIWMDENIRFGKSDSCSTFNNPPLCPGKDFEIKVLEVYGFGGAIL